MKLKYNGSTVLLIDESKHIFVEQYINPFIMKKIETEEDAETWMREFLSNQLNAQPIFFTLAINDLEDDTEAVTLLNHKKYGFNLRETTGRLSGKYKTTISCLNNADKIEVDLVFADGEAILEYAFDSKGEYVFDLDNEFYIGQDKFISIVIENNNNEIELYSNNKRNLSFEIK